MRRETGKATAQRNLRTGTPVWLRHGSIRVPFGALQESIKVDVAVVGAGVTGALVADALLQAGKTIAVVDRRGPARGSTWAMATAPQPDRLWPSRCLIWQAADPYLYLRTTGEGRIIVGGEDEEFSDERKRDALIASKIVAIRRKLGGLLPNVETKPEFSWAACFGTTDTGLPSIGAVPGANRCFAVLGYGGNGITFSTVAAQLVQRAVVGLRDPDEDLFALPG